MSHSVRSAARLRCPECRRELFVTYSCKTQGFCPSRLAKRAVFWTEWILDEVRLTVRHHQWVFTLSKRIRPFFLHDRSCSAISPAAPSAPFSSSPADG